MRAVPTPAAFKAAGGIPAQGEAAGELCRTGADVPRAVPEGESEYRESPSGHSLISGGEKNKQNKKKHEYSMSFSSPLCSVWVT